MIHVSRLTKFYGDYAAVRDVSFDVPRGQVVGFLGPNGAGKSTTMRILAGYLTATSGSATIDGLDVFWRPVEVRRKIGYMPESCPLYPEMRVGEYLRFRAGIKGLHGRAASARVDHSIKRCWLTEVRSQLIGTLSKGYRQRVGLADAMVHDPDLLILDEPTIGLDPNQIRAVRDLIKDLGRHHTILLSTHILSEVELTCSRVLVINRGRIEASDTPFNLTKLVRGGGSVVIEVRAAGADVVAKMKELPEVEDVEILPTGEGGDWTNAKIFAKPGVDLRENVYGVVRQNNWPLRELSRVKATLEEAFIELTQD